MKKLLPIFVFFLAFFIEVVEPKAITDPFNYDINTVTYQRKNGKDYLVFQGWAFIEHQHSSNPLDLHNINPSFTFYLAEQGYTGSGTAKSYRNTYYGDNDFLRPQFGPINSRPDDFSKAYFVKTGTWFYPDGGQERFQAIEATKGKNTYNRFVINVNFRFEVPFTDIEEAVKKYNNLYMYLDVKIFSKSNVTVYGGKIPYIPYASKFFQIGIHKNNINNTANQKLIEILGINFDKTVTQVTVIATYAQGRSSPTLDSDNNYYQIIGDSIGAGSRGKGTNLYYHNDSFSGNKAVYDVLGLAKVDSLEAAGTPVWNYMVRIGGYENCNFGKCLKNDPNGRTIAWIPAYWVKPTTNQTNLTFLCTNRPDCAYNKVDEQKTCPTKTSTPNCCSLCDQTKSPNFAMYRITDFCKSMDKCGTCATDPRCEIQIKNGEVPSTCPTERNKCCNLCTDSATKAKYAGTAFCKSMDKCGTCATDPRCEIVNGVVPSTCPTREDKCCSLCTDSETKGEYADTDFCKSADKCGTPTPTCSNNPECQTAKLGPNSKCPVDKPSDPMSADCCKTICEKPENENTDYCTKTCKKPTPTCLNNPECQLSKLGSNSKCPVNGNAADPMKYDCCKTICAKDEYKGTDYCKKLCVKTPPPTPPSSCATMTDPQEKYCCLNPSDPICKVYEAPDPDYDPSNSSSSEKKEGICDPNNDSEIKFKYPAEGFGKITTTNTACKVSCQEELIVQFKPIQSVRAGMGFKYPINTESTRYCTAEYDNQNWVDGLKAAALAAKNALNAMKNALNEAKKRDSSCGTSTMLTASVPSCPSPYTDGRSGLTCRCSSCNTCWNSCPSTCGGEEYKCGTIEEPDKKCYTQTYLCFKLCNPYVCEGTTSITCPKKEEHQLSYVPDRCEKKICSGDRTDWGSAQSEISSYLNAAQSARNTYTAQISIINRYLNDRKTCDNYISNNPYDGPKDAKVDIDIEEIDNQIKYIEQLIRKLNDDTSFENARVKKSKDYTVYNNKKTESVSNPGLVGDHSARAAGFQGVYEDYSLSPNTLTYYDFWNRKSDAKYQFEFANNYYIQKYTGELGLSNNSAYIYGGRFAYTDFYQQTGKYDLKLTAVELGPHLNNAGSNIWKIDPFKCKYNLTNLIFPPKGDINYNQYGNTGFEFRQISLTEPFPNRQARENWLGKEGLITNVEYGIYNNQPLYHFNLNSSNREKVRFYNSKNKYDSFNPADPYKSNFLKDHNIILR